MASVLDEFMNEFSDDSDAGENSDVPIESEADQNAWMTEAAASSAALPQTDITNSATGTAFKSKRSVVATGEVTDDDDADHLMEAIPPVLEEIQHFKDLHPEKQKAHIGSVEDNPEYSTMTQANSLSTAIDSAIIYNHKRIRDFYSVRFPELEQMISNPVNYAKTVAIIGNGPMDKLKELSTSKDNVVGEFLNCVLDGPTLMVVAVEATTTAGRELSEQELQQVIEACKRTLELARAKRILTEYVESRMNQFAPNLTALIGSLTAAQLINQAGGLQGLSKTPACNIAPLGSKKQAQAGLATNVGQRHDGFLSQSPIFKQVPSDLRKQGMRIVSAKVVLAARVDAVHSSPDGSTGEDLKEQCLERLRKLTEPPPNKGNKALPIPDDKPARKRGGRRARRAKAATAMTDLRMEQNRMKFGEEEKEVGYGDSVKGLGMIGQANNGRIRALQIDERTKARTTKTSSKNKKPTGWGALPIDGVDSDLPPGFDPSRSSSSSMVSASVPQLNPGVASRIHGAASIAGGGQASAAGTASTIAFTPFQGLELVDPSKRMAQERKRALEQDKWFTSGTFTQVGGGGGGSGSGTTGSAGLGRALPPMPPPFKKQNTGQSN